MVGLSNRFVGLLPGIGLLISYVLFCTLAKLGVAVGTDTKLSDDILNKCDYVLEQPLLTEDGFANEACIRELESVLSTFPRTYERLQSDPEWSTPEITYYKEVTGFFALWSVRQLPNLPYPPNLEHLIGYLDACLRQEFLTLDPNSEWNQKGWGSFSLCEINKMMFDILEGTEQFDAWNTKDCLGENWLDLDALLRNVCVSIRDERRINKAFDKKFEEEYDKLKTGDDR